MQRIAKRMMPLITLCLCLMTTFVEAPGGTPEGDGSSVTGDASGQANPAGPAAVGEQVAESAAAKATAEAELVLAQGLLKQAQTTQAHRSALQAQAQRLSEEAQAGLEATKAKAQAMTQAQTTLQAQAQAQRLSEQEEADLEATKAKAQAAEQEALRVHSEALEKMKTAQAAAAHQMLLAEQAAAMAQAHGSALQAQAQGLSEQAQAGLMTRFGGQGGTARGQGRGVSAAAPQQPSQQDKELEKKCMFDGEFALSFARQASPFTSITTLRATFISRIVDQGRLTFERNTDVTPQSVKYIAEDSKKAKESKRTYIANNEALLEKIRKHILEARGERVGEQESVEVTFLILPYTSYRTESPLCVDDYEKRTADLLAISNVIQNKRPALEVSVNIKRNEIDGSISVSPNDIRIDRVYEGVFSNNEMKNLGQQLALMFIHFTVKYEDSGTSLNMVNEVNEITAIEQAREVISRHISVTPNAKYYLDVGARWLKGLSLLSAKIDGVAEPTSLKALIRTTPGLAVEGITQALG